MFLFKWLHTKWYSRPQIAYEIKIWKAENSIHKRKMYAHRVKFKGAQIIRLRKKQKHTHTRHKSQNNYKNIRKTMKNDGNEYKNWLWVLLATVAKLKRQAQPLIIFIIKSSKIWNVWKMIIMWMAAGHCIFSFDMAIKRIYDLS